MTKKEKQFIVDMKRCRGMDFVRIGMMVEVNGQPGTIVGLNSSANLDVIFANQLKMGKGKQNCHPQYEIRYFDQKGDMLLIIKSIAGTEVHLAANKSAGPRSDISGYSTRNKKTGRKKRNDVNTNE